MRMIVIIIIIVIIPKMITRIQEKMTTGVKMYILVFIKSGYSSFPH